MESILNQTPLTPISDDVNDLKTLTPSYFIIGSYENTVPGVFHKQKIHYRRKWRSVQAAQTCSGTGGRKIIYHL